MFLGDQKVSPRSILYTSSVVAITAMDPPLTEDDINSPSSNRDGVDFSSQPSGASVGIFKTLQK